jgi:threonine/homoserine/homoserine lactone efflux protein
MSPFTSFLVVAALAVLVPGPDTFVVLRTSLTEGVRAGVWAAAGSAAGNLVWGVASVLGVAALLHTSAAAFSALKLLGAAYLVMLGVQALRAARRGDALAPEEAAARLAASPAKAFRRGVASDLLNVKVGLFWTALMPQFVSAGSSALLPAAMVLSMGSMVFGWLAASAYGASRLSGALRRRRSSRAVNGTVGAAFVALGGRLALASH